MSATQSIFEKATARLAEREQSRQRTLLPDGCESIVEAVRRYEADIIKRALTMKGGRVSSAAEALGVSRQGLWYILDTRQKDLAPMARPKVKRRRRVA